MWTFIRTRRDAAAARTRRKHDLKEPDRFAGTWDPALPFFLQPRRD